MNGVKGSYGVFVDADADMEKRARWTKEDQEKKEDGPHYPHTQGEPTEVVPFANTPEADLARRSVRDFKAAWNDSHGIINLKLDDDGQPIEEDEPEAIIPRTVLAHLDPARAELAAPSIKKFAALGAALGLIVQVQATRVAVADELYSKSNKSTPGMVKKPGYEVECVQMLLTNGLDFATTISWEGKTFKGALVGGQRSGHTTPKWYKLITPAQTKITESFNAHA